MFGVDPPLQLESTVQKTEAVQNPVPSAWNGVRLVDPERPPVMVTVAPFSVAEMFVTVEPATVSLNIKSESPPAPVSTNLFPLFSTTSKRTDVPDCVSVTVPNDVAVAHPPERWQLVRVNVSALAGAGTRFARSALLHEAVRRDRCWKSIAKTSNWSPTRL